ncbi:protein ASPARTIC PROTEASE IN GUARD CELL 2 [Elaeis guineensis]|uniref:Protein ASPARTIC PROTEASE IN GUARD CELL 2 n=1 Tax=Elaeis guineensis var. tenera TaxID=51953 RepID=A0A6I9S1N6_ELAGV|nr:protein ASPARTIC PROTEASE IN GUARD CELL 2 [Elaeis guineensis]
MQRRKMAPPLTPSLTLLLFQLLSTLPFTTLALHFHHVNLHDLITGHRPPDATPQSHHHNPHKLSLDLLHRDSLPGRNHSTLHHRLIRDSHRVSFLLRRLGGYHLEDFGSDVVSGLDEGSGEYFVRIGLGSPPKEQFMVIDSGSDIVWVQCQPCTQCYAQSDPVFDPADSASFAGISCNSPICDIAGAGAGSASCGGSGRCLYEVSYGDGSYTKGTLALETLTFGATAVRNVAIGCGHRNRGLFTGAAGLLGLGWGPMSFVGQLGGQVGGAFSYCLVSRGSASTGSLVFGRSSAVPVGAVWVPLLRNPRAPSFYYVGLSGLGVGGVRLPLGEELFQLNEDGDGGVVMDTGTAVTRLPGEAYGALRDAFAEGAVGLPRGAGVSIFDTCYDLGGYESVRVPTVSFYFSGGTILTLPAQNLLIPVDESGTFCFAFAPSSSGMSILGNIQQEGIQITLDSANGFVGFGPTTC